MGNVQAPVALSSSNKVNMMGRSFCLLSSLNMKPLSSCNTADGNEIKQHYISLKMCSCHKHCAWQVQVEKASFTTSRVVRYPESFLTIGSRAQVLACASQTKPRLNRRAFRLYFLCSMHTGHPINFFPIAVLHKNKRKQGRKQVRHKNDIYGNFNIDP